MSDDDLDLVETDALLSALTRRAVGFVYGFQARQHNDPDGEVLVKVHSNGNPVVCYGLGVLLDARLKALAHEDMTDGGEDWQS